MRIRGMAQRWVGTAIVVAAAAVVGGTPASAATGTNVGGGDVTGGVVFTSGYVPTATGSCAPGGTSFNFTGTSDVSLVFNTVGVEYAGGLTITATGGDACPSAAVEQGGISVVASGTGPTGGTLVCGSSQSPLTGGFFRDLTHVQVVVSGSCTVNGFASGSVTFTAQGEFIPTRGDGITTPVTAALFVGAFAII